MRLLSTTLATAAAIALLGGCTGTTSTQIEVSEPEEVVESTTTTLPPDCAEVLPPSAQAGQLLMVMVTAPQLATDVLTDGTVGGFGLKGRQSATVGDEVAAAVADAPVMPFVSSDEEGGTVQRLGRAIGELPSAQEMAEGTPDEAATTLGEYAAEMKALGFNMNFGPVADVGSGSDLGSRSFGDDPATVSGFAEAIVGAQQQAGIMSVLKHWPGIGGGGTDPHVALDSLEPVDVLRSADMVPFDRAIAAGVPAIMVAHATVPGLTGEDEPTSLSRAAITDELRGRQGFDGIVITDSLGMGAIVNTVPQDEAAERSIAAGADIALLSGADVVESAHARLTDAISTGRIPAEQVTASVRRVLSAKGIEGECLGLVASFSALQPNGDDGSGAATDDGTSDGSSSEDGTSDGTASDGNSTSGDSTSGGTGSGDRDTGINSSSSSDGTTSSDNSTSDNSTSGDSSQGDTTG